MPIQPHPSFKQPQNGSQLWRYMDLAKFVSLITGKQLWLSNTEVLAQMDPYEGLLPKHNYIHRSWKTPTDVPNDIVKAVREQIERDKVQTTLEDNIKFLIHNRENAIKSSFAMRRQYFLSCWHIAPHESAAMWQIYSQMNSGIAITSSPERLTSATSKFSGPLFFGEVQYLDYETAEIEASNVLNVLLAKRKSFEFEREARLVWWDSDQMHEPIQSPPGMRGPTLRQRTHEEMEAMPIIPGKEIPIDLRILIDGIWTSPTMPDWAKKAVQDLCVWADLGDRIRHSDLLIPPSR